MQAARPRKGGTVIGTLFKFVFVLAILAGIGLVGYAYLGDLSPDQRDMREPVLLNVD